MFNELLLFIAGIYLAWSLGANDAGNVISTAVGSKAISFRKAMIFFVLCMAVGAIFLSGNVIKTVSSGIVPSEIITMTHATIALFVAAGWVHFATWKQWPVSISQSVVSAVLGIGLAEGLRAGVSFIFWKKILILAGVWLVSPILGFLAGWILFKVVHGFVRHRHLYVRDTICEFLGHPFRAIRERLSGDLERREKMFKAVMIISAGYMAVALGSNTVAATTGLLFSGFSEEGMSLLWDLDPLGFLKMIVLLSVILGILTYGRHLVDFLGSRLVKLNPLRGGVIQFATASVIIGCALMGYPVSSTGVFVGSFLGVDTGEDHPQMKKHVGHNLLMAFLVTIPVTAALSGVLTWFLA